MLLPYWSLELVRRLRCGGRALNACGNVYVCEYIAAKVWLGFGESPLDAEMGEQLFQRVIIQFSQPPARLRVDVDPEHLAHAFDPREETFFAAFLAAFFTAFFATFFAALAVGFLAGVFAMIGAVGKGVNGKRIDWVGNRGCR